MKVLHKPAIFQFSDPSAPTLSVTTKTTVNPTTLPKVLRCSPFWMAIRVVFLAVFRATFQAASLAIFCPIEKSETSRIGRLFMCPFQMVLRTGFGADIGVSFWVENILLNCHPVASSPRGSSCRRSRRRRATRPPRT